MSVCWYWVIGVNAAGAAGVATPQYLTCVDDPPIRYKLVVLESLSHNYNPWDT